MNDIPRLVAMPGSDSPADWASQEPTEVDATRIGEFMRRAHEVGQKAKQDNRWCGDYEAAMTRMGISNLSVAGSGRTLMAEEVSALPEGTLLRYSVTGLDQSVIYRRDDRSLNEARTVRIGGTLPGAWRSTGMMAMPTPFPVLSVAELDAMPPGTRINDTSYTYIKQEAGEDGAQWLRSGGGGRMRHYRSTDFIIGHLTYVSFP